MSTAIRQLGQKESIFPKDRLATELAAMTLLHEISTRFVQEGNTKSLFEQIVNVALEITGADLGNIQVLDEVSGRLKIVACCSLEMPLPDCCKQIDKRQAACGIAMMRAERLVIDDVTESSELAGSASLDALLSVGVRAVQSTPLFTRSGRLVGMLSTHSRIPRRLEDSDLRLLDMLARQIADIIERSQATEALRASAERYRCLFENMLDAYTHCRMIYQDGIPIDFEYLAVNPAFAKLTGLQDVVGRKVSEVIPGVRHDNPELLLIYGQVAQTGEPARFETYVAGLGAWLSIAVYRPAAGEFVAVFDNISKRKQLEKDLQGRRGEMETLLKHQVAAQTAAAIAHDLNQPLVAISAYSEAALRMLRNGTTRSEKLTRALEGNFEQAQRAGQTLHELLDFLHNGDTVSTPMDINEAVREAIAMADGNGYGQFQAAVELANDLPPVLGNRVQIQKVLDNLLHNAIDAMREAGMPDARMVIGLRTAGTGDRAQVTIRDSGPGLEAENNSRVFEPFFTTKPKGIGLGLAISRTLIEAHGGKLWAEPGPGATFHFTLPFAL